MKNPILLKNGKAVDHRRKKNIIKYSPFSRTSIFQLQSIFVKTSVPLYSESLENPSPNLNKLLPITKLS